MRNMWKKIAALTAIFCITLTCGLLSACVKPKPPEPDDGKMTLTITVIKPDNTPVEGVFLAICAVNEETGELENCQMAVTNAEGKAIKEVDKGNYHVEISTGIPQGFASPNPGEWYTVNTGSTFTITLTEASALVSYSFKVAGFSGVDLNNLLITNGSATSSKPLGSTNANGELTVSSAPLDGYFYLNPPKGYTYDKKYGDNSPYAAKRLGGSYTFNLVKQNVLTFETQMPTADREEFAKKINSSTFRTLALGGKDISGETLKARDTYSYTFTIPAKTTQVFTFTADDTDTFTLFASYNKVKIETLGASEDFSNTLGEASRQMGIGMNCTRNRAFNFIATGGDVDETIQIVIVKPVEKNETFVTKPGTVNVQIKEDLPAVISFTPETEGQYRFTIETNGNFLMEQILRNSSIAIMSTEDKQMKFDIFNDELFYPDGSKSNQEWLVRISQDTTTYPVDVQVKIERIGDPWRKPSVTTDKAVETTLKSFSDQIGELTALGVNNSNSQVFVDSYGLYHYGSVSGPVIVIKLQGTIESYYEIGFELLDKSGTTPYRFNVTTAADMVDDSKPYQFLNYSRFLRGYGQYDNTVSDEEQYQNDPDRFKEYYLKYVNSDGVYPLNDELKEFLELFAQENSSWIAGQSAQSSKDSLWLFSAYYYDTSSDPGTKNNPISVYDGYKLNDVRNSGTWCIITAVNTGYYSATFDGVNADGEKVKITVYDEKNNEIAIHDNFIKAGEWIKFRIATNYGVTANVTVNIASKLVTPVNPENVNDSKAGTEAVPYKIKNLGDYKTAYNDSDVYYSISTPGTYAIFSYDTNATVTYNKEQYGNGKGVALYVTATSTAPAVFSVSSLNGKPDDIYLTINEKVGYDANHAISLDMQNDVASGSVTFVGQLNERNETVAELTYYTFTAPKNGYYVITLNDTFAELVGWNGIQSGLNAQTSDSDIKYAKILKSGEKFEFCLTSRTDTFPSSYDFTIVWNQMPDEGTKELPKKVSSGSQTIELKAGEEYFFEVVAGEIYKIEFTTQSGEFVMYDLGMFVTNDDRREPAYLVYNGAETMYYGDISTYYVVTTEAGCNMTVKFTKVEF